MNYVARRRFAMVWDEVSDAQDAIYSLCGDPTPLDGKIHAVGVDLARAHGLRIYDAFIISAALAANCNTLYTDGVHQGARI